MSNPLDQSDFDQEQNPYRAPQLTDANEVFAQVDPWMDDLPLEISGADEQTSTILATLFQQVWRTHLDQPPHPLKKAGRKFHVRIHALNSGNLMRQIFSLNFSNRMRLEAELTVSEGTETVFQWSETVTVVFVHPTDTPKGNYGKLAQAIRLAYLKSNCREFMYRALRKLAQRDRLASKQRRRFLCPLYDDTQRIQVLLAAMGAIAGTVGLSYAHFLANEKTFDLTFGLLVGGSMIVGGSFGMIAGLLLSIPVSNLSRKMLQTVQQE